MRATFPTPAKTTPWQCLPMGKPLSCSVVGTAVAISGTPTQWWFRAPIAHGRSSPTWVTLQVRGVIRKWRPFQMEESSCTVVLRNPVGRYKRSTHWTCRVPRLPGPYSPMLATFHLGVRYFSMAAFSDGTLVNVWWSRCWLRFLLQWPL